MDCKITRNPTTVRTLTPKRMPVIEEIQTNQGTIKCWKITESVRELELQCSKGAIPVSNTFTLESRYRQNMVTNLLYSDLFPGSDLSYLPSGKPVSDMGTFVSISHSGDLVVMMRSDISCGVDIERIHPRVGKVRHKFLNDDELHLTTNASTEILTQYWTSKEAMFKVHGTETIFMRSNIFVRIHSPERAEARLTDGALEIKREIRSRVADDMMLAWTESEDEG